MTAISAKADTASGTVAATLENAASALDLQLSSEQRARLLAYVALLERWNRTYNLTAVHGIDQMIGHHLLDCLAVVQPLRRTLRAQTPSLLDVGSGAGLPGIILAVMFPGLEVTCLDSIGKKTAFIREAASALALPNLRALKQRIEATDGAYEVIVSRAFSTLANFVSWSAQAISPAGFWLAMKGKNPAAEIAELPSCAAVFHVEQLQIPLLAAERCLVWINSIDSEDEESERTHQGLG